MLHVDVIVATAVACVLLLWFALSVANQFNSGWMTAILVHDQFRLIPRWTFFAPNPGIDDYHLMVRDFLEDGSATPWVEIRIGNVRSRFCAIWNPNKRFIKMVHDCVVWLTLLNHQDGSTSEQLQQSIPYKILLQHAWNVKRVEGSVRRQFGIVQTTGRGKSRRPELLLASFPELIDGENAGH